MLMLSVRVRCARPPRLFGTCMRELSQCVVTTLQRNHHIMVCYFLDRAHTSLCVNCDDRDDVLGLDTCATARCERRSDGPVDRRHERELLSRERSCDRTASARPRGSVQNRKLIFFRPVLTFDFCLSDPCTILVDLELKRPPRERGPRARDTRATGVRLLTGTPDRSTSHQPRRTRKTWPGQGFARSARKSSKICLPAQRAVQL